MLAGFETFLFVLSSLLLYPVVIGLVGLVLWMIMILGGFIRDFAERKRGTLAYQEVYKKSLDSLLAENINIQVLEVKIERLLQEKELKLIASLDRVRFAIRVGPALGLMGTLIPMGVALSSLAQGDMPKMAGNMVTAFTTTVVGLACGVIAYLISMIKERWIKEDIREMEFYTEMSLMEKKGIKTTKEVKDEIYEEKKNNIFF